MSRTVSILRWVTLFAALPFLYFVFTNQPHNWLYNLSLSIILIAWVAQLFYFWKTGKKENVKHRLILFGLVLLAMVLLAFLR